MEFKVGQKVRMVENNYNARVGDMGVIVAVVPHKEYAVEFPCFKGKNCGHNCDGLVPSGNGHWIEEDEMELASEQEEPEITQVTIKGDSGTTIVRAKVTKGNNGYTIEKLAEPKFAVGEQFVTSTGKLGIVTKVNPDGNYCVQLVNRKYYS